VATIAALVLLAGQALAADNIRVLILSGQNNHKWQETTPKLKAILEASQRFTVDVTEHPEQCDAATFAKYDVILSNWNTWTKNATATNWPDATRAAYLDFIRDGKGVVTVHAGSSSFFDWTEYQQIAGATWKLGQTHHGKPREFTVKFVAAHPITDGLQPFTTTDELWEKPGVAPGATILATADGEPSALVTSLGKGRGFTTLLGHDAEKMDNPGFKTLLVRGVEWAAIGTIVKPDLMKAIAGYKFGDSRAALLDVERAVQAAPAEWAPKLAALLASDATLDCKKFVCWQLSLCGTAAQVPALEKLLSNSNLALAARSALERIRGEKTKPTPPSRLAERIARMAKDRDLLLSGLKSADEAALRALRSVKDAQTLRAVAQLPNLSAPMLAALADAGEKSALPAAAKAASSDDTSLRRAAVEAIGALGNASSVPVLVGLLERADKDERKLIGDALARLRGAGVDAALVKAAQPEAIRALVARDAKSSVPALLELANGGNAEAISALGKLANDGAPLIALLGKDGVESALVAVYRRTGNIQPLIAAANGPKRAFVLTVLGALGGDEALAVLRAALKGDDALAAVRALSNWETAAPLADLEAVAANATDAKLKALAQRGVARLETLGFDVKGKKNLARGSIATNPDGLKPDGQGSPAPAAIDGDLKTYWDETNDQKLYQLRIQMKKPAVVRAIRITGYRQHDYAPKDFDVLCDDKMVKSVKDAQYQDNVLVVTLPATQCATIQLNITGYYGHSPAIRELEIYGKD
jgi:type 1 glutamine amidotransferase/HEAT repeat protein